MRKIISTVLAIALAMTSMLMITSAAGTAPVETTPATYTADDVDSKGMIGNLSFAPKYTIAAVDSGVKIDGAADRGVYERVEVRGLWTLDGLRLEMSNVSTKSSLLVALVKTEVGGFPTGGAGVGIGLDPTSNKLWITAEGANTMVAASDTALDAGWSTGTAPGAYKTAAGKYSIQFNKTLRGIWVVTVDDCAAYEVPAATFDTYLNEDGGTMLSFVSNAASDVTDKAVTFTVNKFVENAAPIYIPNVRTAFIPKAVSAEGEGALFSDPKQNTSVDNGYIFNNVFGGSYELTNLDNDGGVSVYAWDDRGEYERLNIGGLWNMDGLRIELKDVESASPIMLGLINNYGQFVTPTEKLSAFAIGYENDSLRVTDGAENVYKEDTAQELKDKELMKPILKSADVGAYWNKKSDYTIQFNKSKDGKWLVTVDDCIQYELDEAKLGENVNMESTALAITTNPKGNEAKFTIAAIKTGMATPVIKGTANDNNGGANTDNNKPADNNNQDKPVKTGVAFPIVIAITAAICIPGLFASKKRKNNA